MRENKMDISLEKLGRLRNSAKEQLEKATDSLLTFKHCDGWFWRDTEVYISAMKVVKSEADVPGPDHSTTTQRAYAGLAYAEMAGVNKVDKWVDQFVTYIEKDPPAGKEDADYVGPVDVKTPSDPGKKEEEKKEEQKKVLSNNFKLAHHASLWFAYNFLKRYHKGKLDKDGKRDVTTLSNAAKRAKKNLSRDIRKAWRKSDNEGIPLKDETGGGSGSSAADGQGSPGQGEAKGSTGSSTAEGQWREGIPGQMHFGENSTSHYFASLHCARAWSTVQPFVKEEFKRSKKALKEFCISQGYYHEVGLPSKVDPPELTFATALYLAYAPAEEAQSLCDSLCKVLEGRISNGVWPATRPVRVDGTKHWHIASVEIALCLTWLYFQDNIEERSRERLVKLMTQFFEQYVIPGFRKRSIDIGKEKGRKFKGWCNDHRHLEKDYIEGWTTAVVCHFLANYRKVLDFEANIRVVRELKIADCDRIDIDDVLAAWREHAKGSITRKTNKCNENNNVYSHYWFDLAPFCWRRDDENKLLLKWWRDPKSDEATKKGLEQIIVDPIIKCPAELPNDRQLAFILYGPPGTGKTTLVEGLAEDLCWAYVPVLTPTFLVEGLERLESRAERVFDLLRMMSRTVIFFDECEELFAKRDQESSGKKKTSVGKGGSGGTGSQNDSVRQRTIGAFITAGMLPRLQKLHDLGANIFVLATNLLEVLDDAVVRPGRFDFTVEVSHPDLERVTEYIGELVAKDKMSEEEERQLIKAVKKFFKKKLREKEFQLSFGAIDTTADFLNSVEPTTPNKLLEKLIMEKLLSAAKVRAPTLKELTDQTAKK